MADISKIKLPNGVEYDVKDATARSQSGVTGVKGVQESRYRTGNVSLNADNVGAAHNFNETINGFSPEKGKGYAVKIDRLENAFYFADKRWSVTAIATDAQGATTTLTQSQISRLFDMSEHDDKLVPMNGTLVITMDFTGDGSGVFKNYPYGDVCIQFYANRNPASITARVYGKHTGSESYWSALTVYEDSRNTGYANRYIVAQRGMYNMQKLEFTINGPSDKNASVSQIAYYLIRADKNHDMPYVSKLRAETLYYNLTAPKFIGPLEGNVTGKASENLPLSGGTMTGPLKWRDENAIASTSSPQYFVVIDSFISGGTTRYANTNKSANALLNGLNTGSSTPVDADYYISQYVGGGTTTTTYHRRPMSALWAYIKGKIESLVLSTSTSSTSTTTAATSSAVKTAYDLANDANTTAGQALSGVNGNLIYDHTFTISNGVATFTPHVYQKGVEVTTNYATSCFTWKYRLINGTEVSLTTKNDRGCDVTISSMGYGGHVIGIFTPS